MQRLQVGLTTQDLGVGYTSPSRGGWSNEPESKEHKELKEWVSTHPEILGIKALLADGTCEWVFPSADRPDVLFEHDSLSIVVEVKSSRSADSDLERGIYQCIKYRALMRADLKVRGKKPTGYSVLVSERKLSLTLQEVADLLGVRVIVVKRIDSNSYTLSS
jgi:hypothetical protein